MGMGGLQQCYLRHETYGYNFWNNMMILVNLIKINHGEPPGKTAQPQGLHGSGLG